MALRFHQLRIAEIERSATDSVALIFDVPDRIREDFSFRPGQHVSLQADVGGETLRRTYSIASCPGERLTVGIRVQKFGKFSSYANGLTPGSELSVMTPSGRFVWSGQKKLLLIAAGSGITPVLSIAGHALAGGAEAVLLYGNRTANSAMFLDRLAMLKNRHMTRFRIFHTMSREDSSSPLAHGRLDGGRVQELAEAGVFDPADCDGAFICGPGSMLKDIEAALANLGLDNQRIHTERYAPVPSKYAKSAAAPVPEADGAEIEVILDGARKQFRYDSADGSVIAAGLRSGHTLPFSCRGGMCCTCRCKVLEGPFEMALNYSLQNWELESGYTLACQTRPTGKRIVLDFDAA